MGGRLSHARRSGSAAIARLRHGDGSVVWTRYLAGNAGRISTLSLDPRGYVAAAGNCAPSPRRPLLVDYPSFVVARLAGRTGRGASRPLRIVE